MKSLLIILLMFWPSCDEEPEPTGVPLGEPFTLLYGETKTVGPDGVGVRFTEVLEDSRCPEGVECIWAGRVIIRLSVTGMSPDTVYVEPSFSGDIAYRVAVDTLGYRFTLLGVDPWPGTVPTALDAYVAHLQLSKL